MNGLSDEALVDSGLSGSLREIIDPNSRLVLLLEPCG